MPTPATEPTAVGQALIAADWVVRTCVPLMLDETDPDAAVALRSLDPIESRQSAEGADAEVTFWAHLLRREGREAELLWVAASVAELAASALEENDMLPGEHCAEEVAIHASGIARQAAEAISPHDVDPVVVLVADGTLVWRALEFVGLLELA